MCVLNRVCVAHLGVYILIAGIAVHSVSVVSSSSFRFILCVSQCVLRCVCCVCVLQVSLCLCAVVCFSVCELLCLLNVCDWDTWSLSSGNQGPGEKPGGRGCHEWALRSVEVTGQMRKEGCPWKRV